MYNFFQNLQCTGVVLWCVLGDQKKQQPDPPGRGLPGPVWLHPGDPLLLSGHPELTEPQLLHRGVTVKDVRRRWVSLLIGWKCLVLGCTL